MHGAAPVKAFEKFICFAELFSRTVPLTTLCIAVIHKNQLDQVEGVLTTTETHR